MEGLMESLILMMIAEYAGTLCALDIIIVIIIIKITIIIKIITNTTINLYGKQVQPCVGMLRRSADEPLRLFK